MLTTSKKNKLFLAIKNYHKKYLSNKITELDESGTRLMINTFLTDVLGFAPIEEVKTEYMIKGTYADYVIQTKEIRRFLVEVKSLSFELSDKHLRQATNYGANEGIEWALLTNGKNFQFYKILFNKPIESKQVFAIDLSDASALKENAEILQYLHRDSVTHKGLDFLWNRYLALDPLYVAGLLYTPPVIFFLKRILKKKFKDKFSDEEVTIAIDKIIAEPISLEKVQSVTIRRTRRKKNEEHVRSATDVIANQEATQNTVVDSPANI